MLNQKIINKNFLQKINLIDILQILILSLIPALILGPLIAEIILSISIIIFLICILKDNFYKKFLIFDKFFYFFCFFYGYFLLNSFFSFTPSIITLKIFFFFRFIILLIIIHFLISKDKNFLVNLSKIALFTFIIIFFDALLQKMFTYNILGQKYLNPFRISSFFGDELVMGGYISRLCPIVLFGAFLFKNPNLKKLSVFTYIISIYFVLISGERAALVSLIISLMYFLIFLNISFTFKVSVAAIIIVFSSFFLTFDNKIKTRIINHYSEQTIHSSSEKNLFFKFVPIQLIEINKSSSKMFAENKFFGLGPYSFRYYCDNKLQEKVCRGGHPHNSYLQLLAETGLIGVFYFLIPFALLIFTQFKAKLNIKNSLTIDKILNYNLFTISSCLVFIFLWPINQHGNIFNNWLNISYYISFSIYIYFLRKKI